MQNGGGRIDAEGAKPHADGEDRLSALPDDLLLEILLRVDSTREAARTSVLASRWYNLWRGLPEVRLDPAPDGNSIRDLLREHDSPSGSEKQALRYVFVSTGDKGSTPASVMAWLPIAARRLVGALVCNYRPAEDEDEDEGEDGDDAALIHLPLFENATKIQLMLGFVGFSLPPQGVFASLHELSFTMVDFRGPCNVGKAVSTSRCPRLHKLHVELCRGLQDLTIQSDSLLRIDLVGLRILEGLTIESQSLQELGILNCSVDSPSDIIVDVSAPNLCFLSFDDVNDQKLMRLGDLGKLRQLKVRVIAYGNEQHRQMNAHCLMLLSHFKALDNVKIHLTHMPVGLEYLLHDLTELPQVNILQLDLRSSGHDFGATVFHLLRLSKARILLLQLITTLDFEAQYECTSRCIHEYSASWKTEEVKLDHLEEVHVVTVGDKPEIAFMQRLLDCAASLKSFRITLKNTQNEEWINELHTALEVVALPKVDVKFDIMTTNNIGSPQRWEWRL